MFSCTFLLFNVVSVDVCTAKEKFNMRKYYILIVLILTSVLGFLLYSLLIRPEITISNYWPDVPNSKYPTSESISRKIMDRHLKICKSKHVEINTHIYGYKIHSINVIKENSYGILFSAIYSVKPVIKGSQWFDGSGDYNPKTGWIKDKVEYIYIRKYIRNAKEVYCFVKSGSSQSLWTKSIWY